jgi:hypothetical protein
MVFPKSFSPDVVEELIFLKANRSTLVIPTEAKRSVVESLP